MNTLDRIESKYLKEKVADFGVGDTVRVLVRVVEGDKEREQAFQGVVIQRRGGGSSSASRTSTRRATRSRSSAAVTRVWTRGSVSWW